jgi:hypothetical protein
MASRTVTSYGPQAAQANEELPPESSLDITLTQHPRDEEPEPREVRARLEVEPPRATPNSLKDSNVSPSERQRKKEESGCAP